MNITSVLTFWLICGAISAAIGTHKNLRTLPSFLWGALLGIIGIIVVICSKPGLPAPPQGMRAVKCPRCNAVQNIPETQPEYQCWQCQARTLNNASHGKALLQTPVVQPGTVNVRCYHCRHVQAAMTSQSNYVCEACGAKLQRKS